MYAEPWPNTSGVSSAAACQALCAARAECYVYAWSGNTHRCYFRTDNVWGAPGTGTYEANHVSGCLLGFATGCGVDPRPSFGPMALPLFVLLDADSSSGLAVVYVLASHVVSFSSLSPCVFFSHSADTTSAAARPMLRSRPPTRRWSGTNAGSASAPALHQVHVTVGEDREEGRKRSSKFHKNQCGRQTQKRRAFLGVLLSSDISVVILLPSSLLVHFFFFGI